MLWRQKLSLIKFALEYKSGRFSYKHTFFRYIHIKDPLQYTELITRRSVPITIGVIWVTSALISFLPISLDLHSAAKDEEVEGFSAVNVTMVNSTDVSIDGTV